MVSKVSAVSLFCLFPGGVAPVIAGGWFVGWQNERVGPEEVLSVGLGVGGEICFDRDRVNGVGHDGPLGPDVLPGVPPGELGYSHPSGALHKNCL